MARALRLQTAVFAAALLGGGVAHAQEDAHVQIHGFGTWYYAQSHDSIHLLKGATTDGAWENVDLSLSASSELTRKLSTTVQLRHRAFEVDRTNDVHVDLAQLSWRPNDALLMRFGRLKQAWGDYAEEWRAGTTRPFFDVPGGFYDPINWVLPALDGVAMTTERQAGAGTLRLDLYGGQTAGETLYPVSGVGIPLPGGNRFNSYWDELIGGRLVYERDSGLRVGVSVAHTGRSVYDLSKLSQPDFVFDPATIWGVHASYMRKQWWFRGELDWSPGGYIEGRPVFIYDGLTVPFGFVEGARRLGPVQIGVRKSWAQFRLPDPPTVAPLIVQGASEDGPNRNDSIEMTASYWLSSQAVLRVNHGWVHGRNQAMPTADLIEDVMEAGHWLRPKSRYIQAGVQFSF